ncbi:MAG: PEP-CTERM sorting domain-containing protein [Akkermansiaceae bacterium]|nr:PEP-CTERM sorting domain-containing protein [Akkermansiaceae bacterium]MCF7731925.1 PEP-CTERM sorting domain-containing protein [Akkermansiaceae bacterium]
MKNWTTQAEQRLTEYLAERATREGFTGEDAVELKEDLRRHIHEESQQLPAETISLMQLEQLLGKLDAGYRPAVPASDSRPARLPLRWRFWSWTAGVVLPLAVLLFEAITRFCGGVFFDPVPTWWHILLVAMVPGLNVWLLRSRPGTPSRWSGLAAGFSLGVSLFYGALFLPIVHLSLFALLAFGIGFLSLIPILAAIQSWWIGRSKLLETSEPTRFRHARRWGLAAAGLALLALEGPGLWTRVNLQLALTEHQTPSAALTRLRWFHSESSLLKACYEGNRGTSMATDIPGWMLRSWQFPAAALGLNRLQTADSQRVRELFFRVTGKPFNSLPPPSTRLGTGMMGRIDPLAEDFEFDSHTGGDSVAVRIKQLDLTESRFDGHLYGDARLGYGEWTLVFANGGRVAREARCQIQLPVDGRVSRLTLWVNGEPQEAAFSTVAKVKAAYREIAVVQQRDPVLVTMVAPDTVMVQCFPVPTAGTMKIRLGITAPLTGASWDLPRIIERNFGIPATLEHAVWLQGNRSFSLTAETDSQSSTPDGPAHSLSAAIHRDGFLTDPLVWSATGLSPTPESVWCEDSHATPDERFLIREPIAATPPAATTPPIVVIDGSAAMAAIKDRILEALPAGQSILLLADDTARKITREELSKVRFSGGRDNEPALREAIRLAKAAGGGPIVWLHGPQPVPLAQPEALLQLLERGSNLPSIGECALAPGPNRLMETIYRSGILHRLDRLDNGALSQGRSTRQAWKWRRAASADGLPGKQVSDHLARLWAIEQVESNHAPDTAAARSAIGARYQLVTPLSGAVVLETREQYDRHGLTQGDPSASPQVPPIPEPSSAMLILITLTAALARRRRAA